MRQSKAAPRPLNPQDGEPFASAEEAWLWFSHCQIARIEGARYSSGLSPQPRPCEPDDIYRAVTRLRLQRALGPQHLQVLGRFGSRLAPPDPADGAGQLALWEEALDRLETALRPKGIVA
ncbi:MAG: hypothetical protein ACM31L_00935 [Actinomycetota bacterium]